MRHLSILLFLCCMAVSVNADVAGPYPADPNTLHLYNFNWNLLDMVEGNPIDLVMGDGASIGDHSRIGYGVAVNTYDGISGGGPYVGAMSLNPLALSNFIGSDGAFTFEAIVRPDVALGSLPNHMEIICADGNAGRGWQFRINTANELEFADLTHINGAGWNSKAPIPTTGINAYEVGQWFHVAVTYNGVANTVGNLKFYWTRLDSGASEAQVLASFNMGNDLTATVLSNFGIGCELRETGGYTENFEGLIDEVRISSIARQADDMTFRSTIPWAHNPTPDGQGVVDPAVTSTLSCDPAELSNVIEHNVYVVKNEPNFIGVDPIVASGDPVQAMYALDYDSTYYWRVDEVVSDSNTITGPVWAFKTAATVPEITGDPDNTSVSVSETASYLASFISITPPVVTWYKEAEPSDTSLGVVTPMVSPMTVGNYTLTITDLGSGNYTTQLDIADVKTEDQGYYYCSVTNESTAVDDSQSAFLVVNRRLAFYRFENNTEDSSPAEIDGTLMKNDLNGILPGYTTDTLSGLGSYALNLDISSGQQYMDVTTAAYPKAGLGNGLEIGTISCWVKADEEAIDSPRYLFNNMNDETNTRFAMWLPESSYAIPVGCSIRGEGGASVYIDGGAAAVDDFYGDQTWHMLTLTWQAGGTITLYMDGVQVESQSMPLMTFADWQYSSLIGAGRNVSDPTAISYFHDGAIDNLEVYNYILSPQEVADLYLVGYPDAYFCLNLENNLDKDFDLDGNCRIDLGDFAELAANWLSCGRYPNEDCD